MFHSLFHSFLLAQIFGLYLVILAVIMMARARFYRALILGMDPRSPAVLFSGCFGMLVGLMLVVIHNIWVWEPRVVVTILSWVILIRSVLWLSFPEQMVAWSKKTAAGSGYFIGMFLLLVIGIFLMTKGFYLYI